MLQMKGALTSCVSHYSHTIESVFVGKHLGSCKYSHTCSSWHIQCMWCCIEMLPGWGNEGIQAGRWAENELTCRQFVSMPWEWHTASQWRHRLPGWRRGRGRAHPPPRHSKPPPSHPGSPKEVKHRKRQMNDYISRLSLPCMTKWSKDENALHTALVCVVSKIYT